MHIHIMRVNRLRFVTFELNYRTKNIFLCFARYDGNGRLCPSSSLPYTFDSISHFPFCLAVKELWTVHQHFREHNFHSDVNILLIFINPSHDSLYAYLFLRRSVYCYNYTRLNRTRKANTGYTTLIRKDHNETDKPLAMKVSLEQQIRSNTIDHGHKIKTPTGIGRYTMATETQPGSSISTIDKIELINCAVPNRLLVETYINAKDGLVCDC